MSSDIERGQAIERFRAMVERFPNSEVPRYSLAMAYLDAEQVEEAEAELAEITRIKPSYMMAWVQRTRALMTLERFESAREVCQQAIRLATEQNHQGPLMDCEMLLEEIEEEL